MDLKQKRRDLTGDVEVEDMELEQNRKDWTGEVI
jgi:hypothetical protein